LLSSRRCGNKGQDTRCRVKYGRRGFVSSYYGEVLQAPLFPSPGFMPGPQHSITGWKNNLKMFAIFNINKMFMFKMFMLNISSKKSKQAKATNIAS
jgi:hypothetical protein